LIVGEIRYEDNSVNYSLSITETASRSLLLEDFVDFGEKTVTRPIMDTGVNMTRAWLESSGVNGMKEG
jgi:hypothetical protein